MDEQNLRKEQNYSQETPVIDNPVTAEQMQQTYQTYQQYQSVPATPVKQPTDVKAVLSLVFGILSIVACCCYGIGIVPAIPGLILAILSKKKNPSGIATAGLICSIIGLILSVIALAYFIVVYATFTSSPEYMDLYNEIYNSYY